MIQAGGLCAVMEGERASLFLPLRNGEDASQIAALSVA